MRRVARALLGVAVGWLVTWLATALALKVFTGSVNQAPELWYVGLPTLVLFAAPWLRGSAETTLALVVGVLVVFLVLVLLLDGSGFALAASATLGVPAWLMFGSVAGMAVMNGLEAFRWRWLTTRRIDVWLHHRHES
ncbi:MAG: hypothetical protein Q4P15_09900 [Propionibacteriaceae bacterium]|nr:hypothetical protein [Propionibacteriaceae bacterium]